MHLLPDLCRSSSVLILVLTTELLALVLTLADNGIKQFGWSQLALISFLLQWISLSCAAILCASRPMINKLSPSQAGTLSYLLILIVTGALTLGGQFLFNAKLDYEQLLSNLLIAAVVAGVVLRFFYLQMQLKLQQQSELSSRIQALQARIRPHFLFNSMNSIASLIAIDPDKAERMVEDLSELFRASLAEPTLVNLDIELVLTRQYLAIEQTRLGDRLHIDWQDNNKPDCQIPSLLLQPLLENAIYHGIGALTEGGTLAVTIEQTHHPKHGLQAHIHIANPLPSTVAGNTRKGQGIALENIRHRLSALYDDRAELLIKRTSEQFCVDLYWPCRLPKI